MIASFRDRATEDLYHQRPSKLVRRIPGDVQRAARRKLDLIEFAHELGDLASPPGNRLEALRGKLVGHHSIRVNDQWRIAFRWQEGAAHEVSLVDYH
ncbi:MAG: plasmid maintenance system killer protein [Armatimonadetes bacterium CG_4_10_14_3_um_filter_66_18]|nr:MAG: plasmid maintenance system killer protein [Armatimonadetes bacterium CG06_land_8_20_14_3_00_66_21]PIW17906.1 MAG: plasmid maintenance system killer protein [Armatimonadetes bacterium CG17_big_fil_post_rev_8_21_14_2_50_66_6]PIX46301.1 MAG: plasmid maintenance system killer protein [Armatimonadetes bacterium CG_4_8_14_3_um_filter_66_20]PIY51010.1 MAG: plasmid maintenance system killer protein [Armatimonadetes bacterium CG_4_10_14_3_um_filter_66_18]PIZ47308.1 MAG: plasmid maintenance syste